MSLCTPAVRFISFTIRLRDIALDKIKKLLFQELYETCRRVANIEMCHGNYSMSCKTKKHTYGSRKHLPPPSFRSWRGRNGLIMPNGTRNSRNFQISGKKDNLCRLSKMFEMSFQKRSVPFDFVPAFPKILVQWIAPYVSCEWNFVDLGQCRAAGGQVCDKCRLQTCRLADWHFG